MSFKRSSFDNDNGGSDSDAQPFHKRQRFDDGRGRGRGGRGRGDGFRGRGDGFRGGRGDGFRGGRGGGGFRGGRGGFNRFNNDDNEGGFQDRRGRGGFRGGGDRFNRDSRDGGGFRGRGRGGRFDGGRGRGRGGGRGDFRGGRGGGFRDRSFNDNNNNSIIKVQQEAPDFQNILNDKSENVSLKQYKGQYVVLFIYFKDGTYGCSAEQKAFRDLKEQFDKHNAVILGVSRDDAETHKSAVAEANLNFSLLADTDSKITKSYGALDDSDRVTRCTFIIGPDGKIAAVWGKVFGFNEHAQQVLDKLKEITSGGQGKSGDDNDNDNDNDNDDDDDNNDDNDNDNNDDDDDE